MLDFRHSNPHSVGCLRVAGVSTTTSRRLPRPPDLPAPLVGGGGVLRPAVRPVAPLVGRGGLAVEVQLLPRAHLLLRRARAHDLHPAGPRPRAAALTQSYYFLAAKAAPISRNVR